jgi:hypothetical protein
MLKATELTAPHYNLSKIKAELDDYSSVKLFGSKPTIKKGSTTQSFVGFVIV